MTRGRLGSRGGSEKGQKSADDSSTPVQINSSLNKFRKIVTLQSKAQTEPSQPPVNPFPGKIWDDNIANLEFNNKRLPALSREIAPPSTPKHVRLSIPTRRCQAVIVRKKRDQSGKEMQTVFVMKRAGENYDFGDMSDYGGPRCNRKGQIIAHSILGNVDDFLMQARDHGEFQEIVSKVTTTQLNNPPADVVATVQRSSTVKVNPLLNESNALGRWEREMELRVMEQARLSELLGRPLKELLMSRTDDFVKVQEGRALFRRITERNHPALCYWKTPPRQGGLDQLCSTLTRSEKVFPPTPVLSGDAESIIKEKGKTRGAYASDWFKSPYMKQRDREVLGGVIHICNNVLFDKLEITGKPLYPERQSSVTSLDAVESCDSTGDCKVDTVESCDPTGDCKGTNEMLTISGPSLCINGKTFRWEGSSLPGNQVSGATDRVTIVVYVFIEGPPSDVVKGYATLYNNGSTLLRYSWKKGPDSRVLPINRPRRKVFYFLGDEGIILPGQTIQVPMLFRSRVPGYYSEAWSLLTVPVLVGGAEIRLIFKGLVRGVADYSQECEDIEVMLAQRQMEVMCNRTVEQLVDTAILKAYVEKTRLHDEPIIFGDREVFEQLNPRFYYHPYIVKPLQSMFESVTLELQNVGTSKPRMTIPVAAVLDEVGTNKPEMAISNVSKCKKPGTNKSRKKKTPEKQTALLVADLRRSLLRLPEEDTDDNDVSECSITHKELLLHQLWIDVGILSFSPLYVMESHYQYCVMYGLMIQAVDNMVDFTVLTAVQLGLAKQPKRRVISQSILKKSSTPKAAANTISKVYSMLENVLDGITELFATPVLTEGR